MPSPAVKKPIAPSTPQSGAAVLNARQLGVESHAPLPLLVGIEGPACAGKTQAAGDLARSLRAAGLRVIEVPEFSGSDLGSLLSRATGGTRTTTPCLRGLPGTLAFLSDKMFTLEDALSQDVDAVVADRLTISQHVISSLELSPGPELDAAKAIVRSVAAVVSGRARRESFVWLLDAPASELAQRLARRLGRQLSAEEEVRLRDEREACRRLSDHDAGLNVVTGDLTSMLDRVLATLAPK